MKANPDPFANILLMLTVLLFIFHLLLFLGQGNIVGSLNKKILPVLATLLNRIHCLVVLVAFDFLAFGGGETGYTEESG